MTGETQLFQVTAARYCAGFVVHHGVVVKAAPIIRWTIGLTLRDVVRRLPSQVTLRAVGGGG